LRPEILFSLKDIRLQPLATDWVILVWPIIGVYLNLTLQMLGSKILLLETTLAILKIPSTAELVQ
jgi:hypothetical protein